MTNQTYGLPRWEFDSCGDKYQSEFNVFNPLIENQIKCTKDFKNTGQPLRCGDSRLPLCDRSTGKCVGNDQADTLGTID